MFWGYTPALDVLREYFWWRGQPPCADQDPGEEGGRRHDAAGDASVTITELTDPDGE